MTQHALIPLPELHTAHDKTRCIKMTHQTRRIERDAEHGAERHDAQDMPHKYDEIRRIMHDALSFSFGHVSTFLSFLLGGGLVYVYGSSLLFSQTAF